MTSSAATADSQMSQDPEQSLGVPPTTQTSGGDEPPKPAPALQDTGFRVAAGPGVPDWAVGKTGKEILADNAMMYSQLVSGQQMQAQAQTQSAPQGMPPQTPSYAPGAQMQPQQGGITMPTQEDYDRDPIKATQDLWTYQQQTQLQPMFAQQQANMRQQTVAFAQDKYADEFKRWGPEIMNYVAQLDPGQVTIDMMDKVVNVVRGEHLPEMEAEMEERARAKVEQQIADGTLPRSGSQVPSAQPSTGIDLESEELPENYRRVLRTMNIDEKTLDEFLSGKAGAMYGGTMEERRKGWLEAAKKGDIITETRLSIG